jgi:hypothetical protein
MTGPTASEFERDLGSTLEGLAAQPASDLLDAASGALALAASLTDSRRNVKRGDALIVHDVGIGAESEQPGHFGKHLLRDGQMQRSLAGV